MRTSASGGGTQMCLGIPGKVVGIFEAHGLRMAKVQFGGIAREVCLQYVPDAAIGDYVVVHVGFAITRLNEEEAVRAYRLLEELGQLTELETASEEEAAAREKSG